MIFKFSILFFSSPFFYLFFCCLADIDNLYDTCPANEALGNGHGSIFINGLPCKEPNEVTPSDFKSTILSKSGDTQNYIRSSMNIVTASEFAGLNTLGLSISRTDLEIDGLVATHSHPRASEIMFVSQGSLIVGFIDTSNTRFQKVLEEGDVFVVPRGMMHYCFHTGSENATVFSVLNSQNPGVVSVDAVPAPNVENLKKM